MLDRRALTNLSGYDGQEGAHKSSCHDRKGGRTHAFFVMKGTGGCTLHTFLSCHDRTGGRSQIFLVMTDRRALTNLLVMTGKEGALMSFLS